MPVNPVSIANLIPIKPGEIRNPKGRMTLGAYKKEHWNSLAEDFRRGELTHDELRRISESDPNTIRRAAALHLLRDAENPNMADYEGVLDGQLSLAELRAKGIDTAQVKKCKTKRREIPQGDNPPVVEVEREIELHDRSRESAKLVLDYTDGSPHQTITADIHSTSDADPNTVDLSILTFEELDALQKIRDNVIMRKNLAVAKLELPPAPETPTEG